MSEPKITFPSGATVTCDKGVMTGLTGQWWGDSTLGTPWKLYLNQMEDNHNTSYNQLIKEENNMNKNIEKFMREKGYLNTSCLQERKGTLDVIGSLANVLEEYAVWKDNQDSNISLGLEVTVTYKLDNMASTGELLHSYDNDPHYLFHRHVDMNNIMEFASEDGFIINNITTYEMEEDNEDGTLL